MERKMSVCLGFDLDGETLWTARDPEFAKRPGQISMGAYGPKEGIPRILRLLKKYKLNASFFVPGATCEKYPDVVREIFLEGNEIQNHGWTHTHPHRFGDYESEKDELFRSSDIIEKLTGKRPIGYRSPAWEFSPNTVGILEELDIKWSSNLMHTDRIDLLEVYDYKTKIVEIPVSWVLDDAAYWLYSSNTPGKSMQPLSAVLEYFIEEFDAMVEEFRLDPNTHKNLCYSLTCHPQIIGRPARMMVLEKTIKHILECQDIEFITYTEAYEKYLNNN